MALPRRLDTFHTAGSAAFTIHLLFLPDCCVWCWEIRRAADGTLVASSWADDWMGYASPAGAEAAARDRLRQLRAVQ
jgi:hypothetical protein